MNTLLGMNAQNTTQEGAIRLNGVAGEPGMFRHLFGFVPQDDLMYRSLTVFENVLHSARCRLPTAWTDAEIVAHVRRVLEVLKVDHIADQLIGDDIVRGISGGQRKRVSIAMELAACPLAFFLDEPTSGALSVSYSPTLDL